MHWGRGKCRNQFFFWMWCLRGCALMWLAAELFIFWCPNVVSSMRLCTSQLSCLSRAEMFMGCGTSHKQDSPKTRTVLGKLEQSVTLHPKALFSGFMLGSFDFLKKLNLLRWHWFTGSCRFQVYISMIHGLYIALCAHHPNTFFDCPIKNKTKDLSLLSGNGAALSRSSLCFSNCS